MNFITAIVFLIPSISFITAGRVKPPSIPNQSSTARPSISESLQHVSSTTLAPTTTSAAV
jgi:hypothetical protein